MSRGVLPGRGLALGITLAWSAIVVAAPLAAIALEASRLTPAAFWRAVIGPRALAAYALSFGASFVAAAINVVFGTLVAWVLVRGRLPGRRLIDALVDLPFALPTAVAGIALAATFGPKGVLGAPLLRAGVHAAYSRLGVLIALVFVSLPFTVRAVQPVLEAMDGEREEAAATLGASPVQSFVHVVLPALRPALVTGFALSFARSLGEYGSVVFMSGNMPMKTEIAPLLVMTKLEQFDYAGATAVAIVMLVGSCAALFAVNAQLWRAHGGAGSPHAPARTA